MTHRPYHPPSTFDRRFGENDGNHPCGHPRLAAEPWGDCATCARLAAAEDEADEQAAAAARREDA